MIVKTVVSIGLTEVRNLIYELPLFSYFERVCVDNMVQ